MAQVKVIPCHLRPQLRVADEQGVDDGFRNARVLEQVVPELGATASFGVSGALRVTTHHCARAPPRHPR